ncbi:NIMA (never in mitosis a)-related kinase [Monoraphidium neglectum]|uniref:non-specific serine/threonine protein kinase n=1 Tax=Monoraphidium neglectum TaxID=145388 RepID=A0A0D2MNK5_9CHLO|nr:NIMA (never in mitosis a)-related kinase [Monoraphidium neglectum]KIY96285.1 NIMA (never in mitosis a)-related kinase [Monoraphidium neglectum]|eukprot:XP_013895305.1 NIMA (never in mitosis a)-related kinase [Monoraphidium neglectum]
MPPVKPGRPHNALNATDWQQLAAQVMSNPSSDGSSSPSAAGALHSASGRASGAGGASNGPGGPAGAAAGGGCSSGAAAAPGARGAAGAGGGGGGGRGAELTLDELVLLRQRHRLLSVQPRPEGSLEADFELMEPLGSGGQGSVRRAVRRADGRQFVVKTVDVAKLSPFDKALQRNEAKALAGLCHPNVIRFEGWYQEGGLTHLVTEFAKGGDLLGAIKDAKRRGEPLGEDRVMTWFVQICLALDHIHSRGVLHRDIKCGNILLAGGVAKVADFGVCKILNLGGPPKDAYPAAPADSSVGRQGAAEGRGPPAAPARAPGPMGAEAPRGGGGDGDGGGGGGTGGGGKPAPALGGGGAGAGLPAGGGAALTSSFVGTPQFVSPELVESKPYGVKADIWGAGCVLYELCAGRPPFVGASAPGVFSRILRARAPPLPAWCGADLARVVDWLLEKAPVKRPTLAQIFSDPYVRRYLDAYSRQLQEHLPAPTPAPRAAPAPPAGEAFPSSDSTGAGGGDAPAGGAAAPDAAAIPAFSRSRIRSALLPWGLWAGTSGSGAAGGTATGAAAGAAGGGGGGGGGGGASTGASANQ